MSVSISEPISMNKKLDNNQENNNKEKIVPLATDIIKNHAKIHLNKTNKKNLIGPNNYYE